MALYNNQPLKHTSQAYLLWLTPYWTYAILCTWPFLAGALNATLCGEGLFFDYHLRGDLTNPPAASYSFFWTLFFYVPTLITLLAVFALATNEHRMSVTILLGLLLGLPYLTDAAATWVSAATYALLDITTLQTNTLLLNPLNRYHPALLYTSFALVGIGFRLASLSTLIGAHVLPGGYLNLRLAPALRHLVGASFTALFGGAWWALQEGTWGGWWNWDPSEVLGLIVLLPAIIYLHELTNPAMIIKKTLRVKVAAGVLIGSYFLIQLTFETVSHNFGMQLFFFFYNDTYFHCVLGMGSLLQGYWISRWLGGTSVKWLLRSRQHSSVPAMQTFTASVIRAALWTFGVASGAVMLTTATSTITPWFYWTTPNNATLFLKLNILIITLLMFAYRLKPLQPLWGWGLLSTGLVGQVLPHWRPYMYLRPTVHFVHIQVFTFFLVNTYLFDSPIMQWCLGTRVDLQTPTLHLQISTPVRTLKADLLGRAYLALGDGGGIWVAAPVISFQTTTYTPAAYFLTCSNLTQTNFYLLTDGTRPELLEVETGPLLVTAILSALTVGWWYVATAARR